MVNLIANVLVILGVVILFASLFPIRKLIRQLPPSHIRNRWYGLMALTILFLLGYISFAVAFWSKRSTLSDLIVPIIFFFGACFVWLTCMLALQTAIDVQRVTILEQENIMDPLTGTYNRRYLDRRLEEEVNRAQRYSLPFSILMLDIDHFKVVNDTYGHQAGDLALNYLARLILDTIRASDVVARYGGEEFLVISPNTNTTQATILAERLRQHIQSHELVLSSDTGSRQVLRMTVSIGVSSYQGGSDNVKALVENVDKALYQAKESGRNQVKSFLGVPHPITAMTDM